MAEVEGTFASTGFPSEGTATVLRGRYTTAGRLSVQEVLYACSKERRKQGHAVWGSVHRLSLALASP